MILGVKWSSIECIFNGLNALKRLVFITIYSLFSSLSISQINVVDETFCGPSTVTFTTSDAGCNLYEWYSLSGDKLGDGCTFTTPEIAFDQTYEIRNGLGASEEVNAIDNCAASTCSSVGDPIVNIDFGTGTDNGPALPLGVTDYIFNSVASTSANQQGLAEYTIVSTTARLNNGWWGNGTSVAEPILDHTPGDVNGKMLVINADNLPKEFYRTQVTNLCSSSYYVFSANFINVLNGRENLCGGSEVPFNVTFQVEDVAGNILGSKSTGDVLGSTNLPVWEETEFRFYVPTGVTEVELVLVNTIGGACGNDLAIDDIQLRSCQSEVSLTANAQCANKESVIVATPSAELPFAEYLWQRSVDGGTSWTDLISETDDTLIVLPSDLNTTDEYRVITANSGNLSNSSCQTISDPISITDPLPAPGLTLDPIPSICEGQSSTVISFSAISGSPANYLLDWDNTANTAGLNDVPANTAFTGGPVSINGLASIPSGTYSGEFVVSNSSGTCSDTVPVSLEINDGNGKTQFSCSNFVSVLPADFGFPDNSVGNTGLADISAKFGLPVGSVIVNASNVSVSGFSELMNGSGGTANKATYSFSGSRKVKTLAVHRPIQVALASGGRDGIVSEDGTAYSFTGNAILPFAEGSFGNEYFVVSNTSISGSAGTQSWESDDFTTGVSFYTIGQSNTNVHELEVCAQVDVEVCDSLELPAFTGSGLPSGLSYFSQPNGGGGQYEVGDFVTEGTYYVYDNGGSCFKEESFTVSTPAVPKLNDINNVTACDSFLLPAITGTNLTKTLSYFTEPDGKGIERFQNTYVKSNTTLYVVDSLGECKSEEAFEVKVLTTPDITKPDDTISCGKFVLEAISGINLTADVAYFIEPGGAGIKFNPGDEITSSATLYLYDKVGLMPVCVSEERFNVTISVAPEIDAIANEIACDSFLLPVISGSNLTKALSYFLQPNGTGTEFLSGTYIKDDITLYVVDSVSNVVGCKSERTFEIDIVSRPSINSPDDTISCGVYTLGDISGTNLSSNAGYFTAPDGGGLRLLSGKDVFSSGTIYLYDAVESLASCKTEESFLVNIISAPVLDKLENIEECDSFLLPAISGIGLTKTLSYFSEPNEKGQEYLPNTYLTNSQTLYVVDSIVGSSDCKSAESFTVTLSETPSILGVSNDTVICNDETAELFVIPNSAESVKWFDVATLDVVSNNLTLEVSNSGNYIVELSNGNCKLTSDTLKIVKEVVSVEAFAEPNEILIGETTVISARSNVASVFWSSDLSGTTVSGNTLDASPLISSSYLATAVSTNGCTDTSIVNVRVIPNIKAPNVFTPNGDGENDTFVIEGLLELPDAIVSIYNRWGVLIYETTNYGANEWDGGNVPDGVYYYVVEYDRRGELKSHSGVIHVLNN